MKMIESPEQGDSVVLFFREAGAREVGTSEVDGRAIIDDDNYPVWLDGGWQISVELDGETLTDIEVVWGNNGKWHEV